MHMFTYVSMYRNKGAQAQNMCTHIMRQLYTLSSQNDSVLQVTSFEFVICVVCVRQSGRGSAVFLRHSGQCSHLYISSPTHKATATNKARVMMDTSLQNHNRRNTSTKPQLPQKLLLHQDDQIGLSQGVTAAHVTGWRRVI